MFAYVWVYQIFIISQRLSTISRRKFQNFFFKTNNSKSTSKYMNIKRGISRISLQIHFLVSIEKNSEKGKWISYRDFSQEMFKCFLHLEVTRNISHDFSSISSGYLYLFSNGKSPNFFFYRALKFDKLECVFQQRIFFSVLLSFRTLSYTDVNTIKRSQIFDINIFASKIEFVYINMILFFKKNRKN